MSVRGARTSQPFYALRDGEYVSYILRAPGFVNAAGGEIAAPPGR